MGIPYVTFVDFFKACDVTCNPEGLQELYWHLVKCIYCMLGTGLQ